MRFATQFLKQLMRGDSKAVRASMASDASEPDEFIKDSVVYWRKHQSRVRLARPVRAGEFTYLVAYVATGQGQETQTDAQGRRRKVPVVITQRGKYNLNIEDSGGHLGIVWFNVKAGPVTMHLAR